MAVVPKSTRDFAAQEYDSTAAAKKVLLVNSAGATLGPIGAPTGASEVKTARKTTVSNSTTRVTMATPTSGKKIRILSVRSSSKSATATPFEIYFGTGANITTNAGKEVDNPNLDLTDQPNAFASWPDGAGPVGAADDVVSLRTEDDITTTGRVIVSYREE